MAPGRDVKPGDVLTISLYARVRVLKVTGTTPRRGDASVASLLYEELIEKPSSA
jgi:ribosome-associated heat shock protein Hsp15